MDVASFLNLARLLKNFSWLTNQRGGFLKIKREKMVKLRKSRKICKLHSFQKPYDFQVQPIIECFE